MDPRVKTIIWARNLVHRLGLSRSFNPSLVLLINMAQRRTGESVTFSLNVQSCEHCPLAYTYAQGIAQLGRGQILSAGEIYNLTPCNLF